MEYHATKPHLEGVIRDLREEVKSLKSQIFKAADVLGSGTSKAKDPGAQQAVCNSKIDELIALLKKEAFERANTKGEELQAQRRSAVEAMKSVVDSSQISLDRCKDWKKSTVQHRYQVLETALKEINAIGRGFLNPAKSIPQQEPPQASQATEPAPDPRVRPASGSTASTEAERFPPLAAGRRPESTRPENLTIPNIGKVTPKAALPDLATTHPRGDSFASLSAESQAKIMSYDRFFLPKRKPKPREEDFAPFVVKYLGKDNAEEKDVMGRYESEELYDVSDNEASKTRKATSTIQEDEGHGAPKLTATLPKALEKAPSADTKPLAPAHVVGPVVADLPEKPSLIQAPTSTSKGPKPSQSQSQPIKATINRMLHLDISQVPRQHSPAKGKRRQASDPDEESTSKRARVTVTPPEARSITVGQIYSGTHQSDLQRSNADGGERVGGMEKGGEADEAEKEESEEEL